MADRLSRRERHEDYEGFVAKFAPKRTTDDCYTPPAVYDAVRDWAVSEYGLGGREIARPFVPGGDYERHPYPEGCVVIDNPPFSILTRICDTYAERGQDFFLFAPSLTIFNVRSASHIMVNARIAYENGAKVSTSFLTNLDDSLARTAPTLLAALRRVEMQRRAPAMPRYDYPDELLTASDLNRMCAAGVDYRVRSGVHVRRLDAQIPLRKAIFGSGLLIGERDARRKRTLLDRPADPDAIAFGLSERERGIVRGLDDARNETGERE